MLYSVAHFQYSFAEDWQQALFEQNLADIGFETFLDSDAYIQTALLRREQLDQLVAHTPEVTLLNVEACPDENWNATWESEHQEQHIPLPNDEVLIRPHCAFGAGYHDTTSMLVERLITYAKENDINHCRVLDNGCGTGIA